MARKEHARERGFLQSRPSPWTLCLRRWRQMRALLVPHEEAALCADLVKEVRMQMSRPDDRLPQTGSPTFPTGKVPPQRQKRRTAAYLQAPPRLPRPPSVREVPPRGRQRERGPDESKCTAFDALSPSAGFAGSSLAGGAERGGETNDCGASFRPASSSAAARGSFPQGKLGAAPFQGSIDGARHFIPQSDREARAERGSERLRVKRA
jgi:hypothetical protein